MRAWRSVAVLVGFLGLAWACGGGKPIKEGGTAQSHLAGLVLIAPLNGATVTAYKADAVLGRGEALASVKTDEAGAFALDLPPYQGNLLLVAAGGSYPEPSIGLGVQLGTNELSLLLPNFTTGTKLDGLRVTPVSTLAVAFARYHAARGVAAADAHDAARLSLHRHFGDVDWSTVTPADLTVAGTTNLSPESRAGLVLAGLSWLAKQHAEASELQPGLVVNAATLTSAGARDAEDGTLEGLAGAAALKQGKVELDGLTFRTGLVQAITGFINSTRNASALRLLDVTAFLAAIGTNSDPYLFCPGQVATAACGGGPVDVEPPALAFVRPMAGAGVAGSTTVEVRATDNVGIAQLRFTAPASLASTQPTLTDGTRAGQLLATLDVSALPDGPLELRAEVTDTAGNPAAKTLSITVSNQGPRLAIGAPGEATTVRGSVIASVSATAQAPGATIARIELVQPVPGLGADTLPAADSFSAQWDTTQALEGLNTLTFRAVDSFGTSTEASVTVTVDNVAFGQVGAVVSAGAPVDGLTVQLVAIDSATGLPVTSLPGGPVLGTSSGVTVDGGVSFALTKENYAGPVQLIAEGASASYVDPTGPTPINLPASFRFTTYVPFYRTGDALQRPLTYWTTLADAAALAWTRGRNPAQVTPVTLEAALQVVDPLLAKHLTSAPWSVRTAVPVSLTGTSQSLRDVVYAALPDVGLNQLARELAGQVGLTVGSGFAAPTLVGLLLQDLADGQYDGKAAGVQLSTAGTTPYLLDANTTRIRQALATDAFIRSANNATQLTRQDLQTSGIYDAISSDTSALYPANQPPVAFDNTPPVTAWTVTFQKTATMTQAPVGSSRLVRGLVFLALDSTDATEVSSLQVSAGSTMLSPAQGSTPQAWRGSVDVSGLPDGPLVFTATACDRLANCGTSTYSVAVDNTAPAVTVLKPAANAFVSAAFELEATASDANGVGSLVATAPAGLVDLATTAERLLVPASTWTLSWPEGAQAATLESCDVVGNCATRSASVVVDKTPPTLTWVTLPPANTASNLVSFSVTATDGAGAGVQRVLAGVDYLNPVEGVRSGSTWTFTGFDLGSTGQRNLRIWAEDAAVPANSGKQSAVSGSELLATVIYDALAPTLSPASYKPFKDEDAITLVTDGTGRPVVPAQYSYGAAPNRLIDLGAGSITIKKAATLTGAVGNRPTLTWQVPSGPGEAPITGVTWSATRYSCRPELPSSCSTSAYGSGTLAVDTAVPSPAPASVYFSQELTMPEKGTYAFTYVVTDAAGNSSSRTFTVVWDVVGPPLVVIPDTAWEMSGDPNSAHSLKRSDGTFSRLFGIGLSLFNGQARVKRFLVYNAAPQEVAVLLAGISGLTSRSTTETWVNVLGSLYGAEGAGTYSVDGHTFQRAYASKDPAVFCADTNRLLEPYPCATSPTVYPYIRHVRGAVQQWECFGNYFAETAAPYGPLRLHNTTTTLEGATSNAVQTQYVSPAAAPGSGNETLLADAIAFPSGVSGARVPAATSTAPGVMAVYVVVPVASHSTPLTTSALPHLPYVAGEYRYYYADMADISWQNAPLPAMTPCNGQPNYAFQYAMYYWYRKMSAAGTGISANFAIRSGGGLTTVLGTTYATTSERALGTAGATVSINH